MDAKKYKLYGYRWVVLGVFMFVNLTIQTLWIAFAPISGPAAKYYGVSDLQIGFLAMSFMIAFIPLSIPVAWVIDTYGFKLAVSIGSILMGIFGVFRGMAGDNYSMVLLCTIGIAIAQPFLLNAWTKVPANWFANEERATAVGLVTLSNLVGTALGLVLTPILIEIFIHPYNSISIWWICSRICGLLCVAGTRKSSYTTMPTRTRSSRSYVRRPKACFEG